MPPNADGANYFEDTSAYIEPTAMTGRNAAPITAVSVVHNIKHVGYVAVVVVAGGRSCVVLVGLLVKSCKSATQR